MKKLALVLWVLGIVITWEVLLSPESAICGYSTTVAYTLSVTIPEHAMTSAATQPSVNTGIVPSEELAQAPSQLITEQTTRDHQPIILQTYTVK